MKKTYLYKNIVLVQTFGRWSALYVSDDTRFTLHGFCTATKKEAYRLAQKEIDYLNTIA